jgi:hypothetical protein
MKHAEGLADQRIVERYRPPKGVTYIKLKVSESEGKKSRPAAID